jgi:tetratricopeptide (TPR) repeat protein
MPSQVDRRSTESLFLQIQRYEDTNMIGEASLLALQLVALDPQFEAGWLAAIRTSLIQDRLMAGAELCGHAIRAGQNRLLFGMLQLHILRRTGDRPAMMKLVEEQIKALGTEVDDRLDAVRIRMIAGDDNGARTLLEAIPQEERAKRYAAVLLGLRLARTAPSTGPFQQKARAALDAAFSQEMPGEELAALLLESLDGSLPSTAVILTRLRAILGGEPSHEIAASMTDSGISRLRQARQLQAFLREAEAASQRGDEIAGFAGARARRLGGDTTGALQLLEPVTTSVLPFVRREYAGLLVDNGRPLEALEPLRRLLDETPSDVPLRLDLAQALSADGRHREALELLDGLRRGALRPEQTQRASILAVQAATPLGMVPLCNTWTELARTATPDDWIAAADAMIPTLEGEDHREVMDALSDAATTASQLGMNRLEAFDVAGAALQEKLGKSREALQGLTRALKAHPAHVGLTQRLAQAAMRVAEAELLLKDDAGSTRSIKRVAVRDLYASDVAIAAVRRLMELQPHDDAHLLSLFRAYQARGEVERAKGAVVEATGANGENSTPAMAARAARVLDDAGFPVDALHFYRRAATDPDDLDSWLRYAGALRATGDLEKAIIVCETIIDKGFHGEPYAQAAVLTALHRMAQTQGKSSDFLEWLRERRTRDIPGRDRFLLEAARLLAAEGARTDALLMAKEGLAVAAPDSTVAAELSFLQARLRYEAREYEAAAKAFSAVADKFPESPLAIPALYNAGDVWRRAGSPRLALERWTALATRHSSSDQALAALHEAGLVAYTDVKDPLLARSFFRQLTESSCQDMALVASARRNMQRLDQGLDPLPPPPGTANPADLPPSQP